MNLRTAAYATAPLSKVSLRLRRPMLLTTRLLTARVRVFVSSLASD